VKRILVPIDFSPVSGDVVTRAVALAKPSDASLALLHVVQPPAVLGDYDPALPVIQTMGRAAIRQLARWKAFVEASGLSASTICRRGVSPSQLIVAESENLPADYIVIGSHGHGAFYDLIVGSTTGGVLRRAHCPVVVVPAFRGAKQSSPAVRRLIEEPAPLAEPSCLLPGQAPSALRNTAAQPLVVAPEEHAHPAPKYAN
jgi:nucleotide-binding universal stress UspA family protein